MLMETANKAIALQQSSQQIEQRGWQGEERREQAATGADSLGPGLLLCVMIKSNNRNNSISKTLHFNTKTLGHGNQTRSLATKMCLSG